MKKLSKKDAIEAYKVFNNDFTCRGFQYEIGKKYKHDGNVSLCGSGFHACIIAVDCFNYYNFNPENKVAKVKLWGDIDGFEKDSDKICASNIEIIKEIKWHEVLEIVNIGKSNTGHRNTGHWNTGDRNTGDWNTGDWNTGHWNTGDRNTGDWNTGDWNTGHWNTGDWNTCNRETGFFNTKQNKTINVFNKPCDYKKWNGTSKPSFIYNICLIEFIWSEDMTDKEKEDNPKHETIGGYLKKYSYKEAWRNSWENAKKSRDWDYEYSLLLGLPNFDAKVFKEITGIDPIKEK